MKGYPPLFTGSGESVRTHRWDRLAFDCGPRALPEGAPTGRLPRTGGVCDAFPMLDSLWVPAEQDESRWVMIVLHGLGDSLAGYQWLSDALDLPWLNYRLVNAPDHYFGGYSWYDFASNPGPGIERSVQALTELLEELERTGFPARQTFVFGFSQGCLLTLEIGLRFLNVLAGCVGVSGYLYEPERVGVRMSGVAVRQRFLITHGTWDPLVPIEPVRRQMEGLRRLGLRLEWREFAKEHTIAGEEELAVIRAFIREGRPLDVPRGRGAASAD